MIKRKLDYTPKENERVTFFVICADLDLDKQISEAMATTGINDYFIYRQKTVSKFAGLYGGAELESGESPHTNRIWVAHPNNQ